MKIKVLVVDDDQDFAVALAERLQLHDYEAAACFGGRAAVERVTGARFDVVILDLMMPDMDGMQTLGQIKRAAPLTEVIMLSANTTVTAAVDGMQRGAFEYLTKPCDTETMLRKIDAAHRRKQDQEERIRRALAEAERIAQKRPGEKTSG